MPRKQRRQSWIEDLYGRGQRFLARRAPFIGYYVCEIMRQEIGVRALPGRDRGSLWVGEAGPERKAWLGALEPEREPDFPGRWAQGSRCAAAELDNRCLCYVWFTEGPRRMTCGPGFRWDIPAEHVWVYDALSHPLQPGTYPEVLRWAHGEMKRGGARWTAGQVEFGNRVSRRLQMALGARPLGWLASFKLGPLRLHFEWRSERRRLGLRFNEMPARLDAFLPRPAPALARPATVAG